MVVPFPSNAWNVRVFSSGGSTIELVGKCPPATGMPVFFENFPVTPQRYINVIDVNTGLITVAVTGASGQQLYERTFPWNVNVWSKDAATFVGWPTGVGCMTYSNVPFTPPTSRVRGTDFLPGTGLLYG